MRMQMQQRADHTAPPYAAFGPYAAAAESQLLRHAAQSDAMQQVQILQA